MSMPGCGPPGRSSPKSSVNTTRPFTGHTVAFGRHVGTVLRGAVDHERVHLVVQRRSPPAASAASRSLSGARLGDGLLQLGPLLLQLCFACGQLLGRRAQFGRRVEVLLADGVGQVRGSQAVLACSRRPCVDSNAARSTVTHVELRGADSSPGCAARSAVRAQRRDLRLGVGDLGLELGLLGLRRPRCVRRSRWPGRVPRRGAAGRASPDRATDVVEAVVASAACATGTVRSTERGREGGES